MALLHSSMTATPRAFTCKSVSVGKVASFPPPLVNFASPSSYSSRSLTGVTNNLRLLGVKSNKATTFRCLASGTLHFQFLPKISPNLARKFIIKLNLIRQSIVFYFDLTKWGFCDCKINSTELRFIICRL